MPSKKKKPSARSRARRTADKKAKTPAPAAHVMLTVTVPMALSEPLGETLWDLGVLGVTTEDDETRARPYDPTIPKRGLATVMGTFENGRGLQARVLKGLQGILTAARKVKVDPNVTWSDVEEKDWSTEWKKSWKPLAVGDRVWIVPTWEKDTFEAPKGSLVLWMDPGMAFGTGTHETTQLCVQALERLIPERGVTSLLDVGTGSGVLAMAAHLLAGAHKRKLSTLVGIDIDRDSVRTAGENAQLNGVPLEVSATPVEKLKGSYDVVIANILLDPLKGMASHLVRLCAPGGRLVMSGILERQRVDLEAAFARAGMKTVDRHQLGEWACVTCVRA